MKIKFDLTAGIEKMTGFDKLEGKGNLDAHFEVELAPEELGSIYEAQKVILPEILNFIKEMKQGNDTSEKQDLENKVSRLEFENKRLQGKLEHAEERLSNAKEDRNKWFNKAMKAQGGESE